MKKAQLVINIVLVLAVVFLFINPLKKEVKIGYADNSLLLKDVDKINEINAQLKEEFSGYEEQVKALEAELTQLKAVVEYDSTNTQNKQAFEQKVKEYQELVKKAQTESANREAELLNPVYETVNNLISEWGKTNNYNIIWGAQSTGNILYGDKGSDITEELRKYINEKL